MKKLICFLLALLLLAPMAVACTEEVSEKPQYIEDNKLILKFGSTEIPVKQINSTPEGDNVVIYTRDYKRNNECSLTIGEAQEGRIALSIRYIEKEDVVEFDIVEKNDNVANTSIPVNGFAISIPASLMENVRANVGQLIKVDGYDNVINVYERHDLATLAPDYNLSVATRRINIVNPVSDFEADKIYYIDSSTKETKPISVKNMVVKVKSATNYSGEILSLSEMTEITPPAKGEAYFVFTGEYNVAYAKQFLANAERISFSMIDKANSYTDVPALKLGETVIKFEEKFYNTEKIEADGFYAFDNEYIASVTPATDKERVDVVVVEGFIVQIGEKNARTLIPDGNGFVVSFVGNNAAEKAADFTLGAKIDTYFFNYKSLPQKYVEVNSKYFTVDFVDRPRDAEGIVVLYTSMYGKTTNTNEYGTEIAFADGKVTSIRVGGGNTEIPENGYVLSIHKDYVEYTDVKKLKVGDSVDICLSGSDYSVFGLKYDAINTTRLENMLILYRNKATSGANEFGFEIAVDKDGYAVDAGYTGNIKIPQGGFALSGHGNAKTALVDAYSIGEKIIVDDKTKSITIIKTPKQKLQTATADFANISDKLVAAKKAFLNLEYKMLDEQVAILESILNEAQAAFDNFEFDKALGNAESVSATCENLQYALIESKGVENRAVWHRSYEKSDDEVRATVEKLKKLGVNAVYLETWYEGYCLGANVNIEGITTPAANAGYDALDGFVRICHENGIEVHAWVHNFFVGYYYKDGPEYYNPLFKNYKDKYLIDKQGRDYFHYTANNNYFIFLNSNDRECRDFILNLYEQLVTNYEIDGLHLDYIRYPELNGKDDFGYNQDIIDGFAKKTGITADPRNFAAGSKEQKEWIQYRCDIITSFMGEVYDMVRRVNPDLWLSAATYPDIVLSKNTIAQDVRSFVENGYLDEVFSMSYGVDNPTVLTSVKDYVAVTKNKAFYTSGIAAFLETTPENFAIQLSEVERNGADGVSVFALGNLTPTLYMLQMINGAFRDPSVQVYMLDATVSAQMAYIANKVENISGICTELNGDNLKFIKDKCAEIKKFADDADLTDASVNEKISFCNNVLGQLAVAKTAIVNECGDNAETNAIIVEIEDLEYWINLSAQRLATRK